MEQYIGRFTAYHLREVELGLRTVDSFLVQLHVDSEMRGRCPSSFNGVYHLSHQETFSILRQGQPMTPRELMALVREYQADIADIDAHPTRWPGEGFAQRAKAWYEQQINRARQQLQSVASSERD